MMGIVVPETCWAYNKYNKVISNIYLVLILQLSQWCTVLLQTPNLLTCKKEVQITNLQLHLYQFIACNTLRLLRKLSVRELRNTNDKELLLLNSEVKGNLFILRRSNRVIGLSYEYTSIYGLSFLFEIH